MLSKDECEKALKALYDENDEMEDYAATFSFDDDYIPQCVYEAAKKHCYDTLKRLIQEHFDNPPLSFDELIQMKGLPVWDNADKVWLIVGETYKPFAFDAPIYEDTLSVELRGSNCASDLIITNNFKHHEKFNPNRFYRKQVGNGDDSHA